MKPTLFISYCQKDGNSYADDLETELLDYFIVKRDKSKLIPNDDIYDFMAGIANEDYVIIVLTAEYIKSRNCMLEMAYLSAQEDWPEKTMVLVIDESIYSTERKLEILTYWQLKQQKIGLFSEGCTKENEILNKDKEYLELINSQLEHFLLGISRRLNPSQIAIVNEMVRKLHNQTVTNTDSVNRSISNGEQMVMTYLEKNGSKTMKELSQELGYSMATVSRYLRRLLDSGQVKYDDKRIRDRMYKVYNIK